MKNNIRFARIESGLSQKEVAITLRVSSPSVSDWESGKKNPTSDNLIKLADLFGVTVDYLLGRDTSASSSVPSADVLSPADCSLLAAYHAAPPEIQNIVHTALAPYKTQNPAASENAAG